MGLTPEEMISIFNQMYLDVWEKTREKVNWETANISQQMSTGFPSDICWEMFAVSQLTFSRVFSHTSRYIWLKILIISSGVRPMCVCTRHLHRYRFRGRSISA